jgi:hypothetical protein
MSDCPFIVQITPLILPDSGEIDPDAIVTLTQFADLNVSNELKGYRTATVTIDTHDPTLNAAGTGPLLADLKPFEFAVRVLYEDREEPVFWGQANIITDYAAHTCVLEAQDPSLRMLHHYLRRGDDALSDDPVELDKGRIPTSATGMGFCIDAAQNIAVQDDRNDPSLGLILSPTHASTADGGDVVVERGQECWQVLHDIGSAAAGPDFEMATSFDLTHYAEVATYDPDALGTDRTSITPDTPGAGEVVLDLGVGADNLVAFTDTPRRPTTHAHVLSSDTKHRRTAGDPAASNATGVFVDWIATDWAIAEGGSDDILFERAKAQVKAYGRPPRGLLAVLRPDAAIAYNYGSPDFTVPTGMRAPTFYIGDYITLRAVDGNRSFTGDARIVAVHLTWPGWNGPALTVLDLVPVIGGVPEDEES